MSTSIPDPVSVDRRADHVQRDNLSAFVMNSALFSFLADPSQLTTSLDANATETMWTMVDYSTMSNLPEIVLPDGLYLADQTYVDQWFDLFNSMEAFDYTGFTDNTTGMPTANGGPYLDD